jgi:hypothetical protein
MPTWAHTFAAALLLVLFPAACHLPNDTPAKPPLTILPPTTSWFEGEKLPGGEGNWQCGGFVDLDGDGTPEIVVAGIDSVRIYRRAGETWSIQDLPSGLLANQSAHSDTTAVGCESVDVDGNGTLDLIVVGRVGGFVLLNDGVMDSAGQFSFHQTMLPSFPMPSSALAYAVAAIDADDDGKPDLYVVRNRQEAVQSFFSAGCACADDGTIRCGSPDKQYLGLPNLLLHNLGNGQFDIVPSSGAEGRGSEGLAVAVYDFDGDGKQDLFVGNDGDHNDLYLNKGSLKFENIADTSGLKDHNHGMGIAKGDLDGDGTEEVVLSELGIPLLLRWEKGVFTPVDPVSHGFAPIVQWSWGAEVEDLDNDGDLDLFFLNNPFPLDQLVQFCTPAPKTVLESELLLYRNNGSGYFTAEAGVKSSSPLFSRNIHFRGGHALVMSDIDGDGVLDALVIRATDDDAPYEPWLLHGHVAGTSHGLTVAAPQGAVVEACVAGVCRRREVGGMHSAAAIHPREVHFGLGAALSADVTIEYPHGSRHPLGSVAAGQRKVWVP